MIQKQFINNLHQYHEREIKLSDTVVDTFILEKLIMDESDFVREIVSYNPKAKEIINNILDDLSKTNFEEVTFLNINNLRATDTLRIINKIYYDYTNPKLIHSSLVT